MLEQNLLAPDAQGDWTIVRRLVFLVFWPPVGTKTTDAGRFLLGCRYKAGGKAHPFPPGFTPKVYHLYPPVAVCSL